MEYSLLDSSWINDVEINALDFTLQKLREAGQESIMVICLYEVLCVSDDEEEHGYIIDIVDLSEYRNLLFFQYHHIPGPTPTSSCYTSGFLRSDDCGRGTGEHFKLSG